MGTRALIDRDISLSCPPPPSLQPVKRRPTDWDPSYTPPLTADLIWSSGETSTAIMHGCKHIREKGSKGKPGETGIKRKKIIVSETLPGAAPNRSQTFPGLRRNDNVGSTFKTKADECSKSDEAFSFVAPSDIPSIITR